MAAREATPPPVIGKAGRYTVFITPPPTPKPSEPSPKPQSPSLGPKLSLSPSPSPSPSPKPRLSPGPRPSSRDAAPLPPKAPPSPPPPVQVPPQQFDKPAAAAARSPSGSVFGFFWDTVAKVQDVHSCLDEYLADWFGLNQSKYQWALNDYYESNGVDKEGSKHKELASKGRVV